MKKLVLQIEYGGLGDNLLWSPIPRLAKQRYGYDKVYISTYSEFRNPETKRLVWGYNPYVDGYIEEKAAVPSFNCVEDGKNILDTLVDFVGFPDDGMRFRDPELYYRPVYDGRFVDYVVYEPNYISEAGHPSVKAIQEHFNSRNIHITHQMEPMTNNLSIPGVPCLSMKGLESFCNLIHSCRAFYCLTSGAATLAAAIGKSVTVLHAGSNPMFHHSKDNTYVRLG